MAGGDLRIENEGVSGLGQDHQLEVIDAHSVAAGEFSEERQVSGTAVFLTPEGAEAYDGLRSEEFTFQAKRDPHWLVQWFLGDRTGAKGEQFQGNPGDES